LSEILTNDAVTLSVLKNTFKLRRTAMKRYVEDGEGSETLS